MTPAEHRFQKRGDRILFGSSLDKSENVHWLWHKFLRQMQDEKDRWKWTPDAGYDFMLKVERFAERYSKEGIRIAHCDDSHFTNSDLVVVQHKTPKEWMGLSVVMLSQCSGQPPAEFFLYPEDVDGLLDVLREAKREERRLRKLTHARNRQRKAEWGRIVRDQRKCLVVLPIRRVPMTARIVSITEDPPFVEVRLSGWKPLPYTKKPTITLLPTDFPAEIRSKLRPGLRLEVRAVPYAKNVADLGLMGWKILGGRHS
jgi:hypothetical protein